MKEDFDACVSGIGSLAELQYRQIQYTHADNFDLLLEILPRIKSDVILVLADGAEGMEGVIASKKLCPDTAVVWFSDDEGFGPQSYRLGCTYFASKPVTEHILSSAFQKYRQERIALQKAGMI